MATTCIALLRGINVGRAKRVAMADLRQMLEGLGYGEVRTLLNSGNVVFAAPRAPRQVADRITRGLDVEFGLDIRVTVLTAAELARIVADNPFDDYVTQPSRLLVAVMQRPADRKRLEPLVARPWHPGALALGRRVAYLWCPRGLLDSPLPQAIERLIGDAVTTRTWGTITKLDALARTPGSCGRRVGKPS